MWVRWFHLSPGTQADTQKTRQFEEQVQALHLLAEEFLAKAQ
jgi:hypothetical protein